MARETKDGHTVIHKGVDSRGGKYWLVHDPETGGSKYIYERGHVWAGFKGSQIKLARPLVWPAPKSVSGIKSFIYPLIEI